jgi:hypothetical protein
MILHLFKYFARYPQKEGVLSMFANGASQFPQYSKLLEYVHDLPDPLIPAIENFVFGQSYDDVKKRVDAITGNYLFIDFGEFTSSRDSRNSITDKQEMAATLAMKLNDTADMVEVAIASDITLSLLACFRQTIIRDSQSECIPWIRKISDNHDIVPFVSPEFNSIGWTLRFSSVAADLFNVKTSFKE